MGSNAKSKRQRRSPDKTNMENESPTKKHPAHFDQENDNPLSHKSGNKKQAHNKENSARKKKTLAAGSRT